MFWGHKAFVNHSRKPAVSLESQLQTWNCDLVFYNTTYLSLDLQQEELESHIRLSRLTYVISQKKTILTGNLTITFVYTRH